MTRSTIDFGIDLGTTNSAIAEWTAHGPRIIPVGYDRCIPSAVYISRDGAVKAGTSEAYQRADRDSANAHARFKYHMGESKTFIFRDARRAMNPEELSAEVLKKLTATVHTQLSEAVTAAVVTVPAAFDSPQKAATMRASELAGLGQVVLLQEPIAAALAYGTVKRVEHGIWLVYDFGGGTFDSALLELRAGTWRVLGHQGDNDLGGRLIDVALLEHLILPRLQDEYDIDTNNPLLVSRLRFEAEKAKILLSDNESTEVTFMAPDKTGKAVEGELTVRRSELIRLANPFLSRSVGITRALLEESGVAVESLEGVILVGGPTMAPYVRDRLRDPIDGIGIDAICEVDPLAVVALGAAVHASTVRRATVGVGGAGLEAILQLEYDPVGTVSRPLVGGKVILPAEKSLQGMTVSIRNSTSTPEWDSGRLPISSSGTFFITLFASSTVENVYQITLYDSNGVSVPVNPNRITYRLDTVLEYVPLAASLGFAQANNETDIIIPKGTHLPAVAKRTHKTVRKIRLGDPESIIRLIIVEGESPKSDRNTAVFEYEITGTDISRELPSGTDIELLFHIDASEIITLDVYIPLSGDQFRKEQSRTDFREVGSDVLMRRIEEERAAVQELAEIATEIDDADVVRKVHEIEDQQVVDELDTLLVRVETDEDAAKRANHLVRALMKTIDRLQSKTKEPRLRRRARLEQEAAEEILAQYGTDEDKEAYGSACDELAEAFEGVDFETIEHRIASIGDLRRRIWWRQDEVWAGFLDYLKDNIRDATDESEARRLVREGEMALERGNGPQLRDACRAIMRLLPAADEDIRGAYQGTTIKS